MLCTGYKKITVKHTHYSLLGQSILYTGCQKITVKHKHFSLLEQSVLCMGSQKITVNHSQKDTNQLTWTVRTLYGL